MMMRRMEIMERGNELDSNFERYSMEHIHLIRKLEDLIIKINELEIHPRHKEQINHLFRRIREFRNKIVHGEIDRMSFERFYKYTKEISFILKKIFRSEEIHPELSMKLREYIDRIEQLNRRINRDI